MPYKPFRSLEKVTAGICHGEPISRRDFIAGIAEASGLILANEAFMAGNSSAHEINDREYADLVYSNNEGAPNRLHIIGQAHRLPAPETYASQGIDKKAHERETARVQTEIYRACEQLITNRGVELLLPEGYFADEDYFFSQEAHLKKLRKSPVEEAQYLRHAENSMREWLLLLPGVFRNAADMLTETYPVHMQGVEDREAFLKAGEKFKHIVSELMDGEDRHDMRNLIEFNYLNHLRSARMLENSPKVIEREKRAGRIQKREAIIIIGEIHINHMIDYISRDRATIRNLPGFCSDEADIRLHLKGQGYGCNVYKPRTLLDQEVAEFKSSERKPLAIYDLMLMEIF